MDYTKVESSCRNMLSDGLGLDLSDPNLKETPKRIARMYCEEFFCNVEKEFEDFKTFPNDEGYDQIVTSDCIHFVSMCSHHFLPFVGHAWVLYIPDKLLIGASKMSRLVNHYAKRPQLQENLTHQVIQAFNRALNPKGVMVFMRAIHGCMNCRGVKQPASGMCTSAVLGAFVDDPSMELKGLEMIKISTRASDL